MNAPQTMVDHNALRTNQGFIIGLLILAFILDSTALVGFVGLTMLLGSVTKRPGFILAYRGLRQLNLVQPDRITDHPEPHRFAQTVGSAFLIAAVASLVLGFSGLGWALAWIVVALAALNLFVGFCVGCAAYYWLSRLGVPGFEHQPPTGTRPGWRPEGSEGSA